MYIDGRMRFKTATPTCMGDNESLEAGRALVEVKRKWMWLESAHRKGRK